jgi:hypothetical protein
MGTMTDPKQAWNDVGEHVSALALKLKLHYEEQRGADERKEREEVEDALSRLGTAVQDAFDALGRAAKDPAVTQDVKDVGHSLTEALGVTFSEVSEDLRKAFNRGGGR